MKIYISTDMEGIAGIVLPEQLRRGTPEYAEARLLLVREANAAVEGALAAGADEIIVFDGHGTGFNFPPEEMHPAARWVHGAHYWPRFPFLEGSAGMILLGYHAMAGTLGAVRDHTMSSASWQELRINGRPSGEIALDAAIAGELGVPVIMVSGDDKACAEASAFLGDVVTAEVKQGIARHAALTLAPTRARELVRERAEEAVRRAAGRHPYRVDRPVTLELTYTGTDSADVRFYDGHTVERASGRTIVVRGEDMIAAVRRLLGR
ncbi:MAG: M55 family metallopeptidase [Anaerolineae bacterium]|nr:M55 family metallopeptidase [Anaerolineae bacterium]